ncbi:unnamed protein product [Cyprideis torosa]|uniref:Uncharacterized protein n=1 Tax=Cyprideis torosa TaxID=163714 RepID=A0A7R8ZJT3_9CRUS|nr:unnamed protein product [Cyprideis torosa]CAG0878801.1 unnamed protein product [Cyprideis torosa]
MRFETPVSPFTIGHSSVHKVMRHVIVALVPGTALYCFFISTSVLLNILIAAVFALLSEALVLKLRKRPIMPSLGDLSVLVTAWLFALALPPLLPWWATAAGIVFAIVVAKHLYGGLGYNPFNPAMVGYVLLLISFPQHMTAWVSPNSLSELSPGLSETLGAVFRNTGIDAYTMATPLGEAKTHLSQNLLLPELTSGSPLFGFVGAAGWEWVSLAWLIGGLWMIWKKLITWHIPVSVLGSLFVISSMFYIGDTDTYLSPVFHLFSGATMLGAFFIATDPVTAPASHGGKLIFGCLIGVLIFTIRGWGGYPDGVAFAVLIMNMATPAIDYFYRARVIIVSAIVLGCFAAFSTALLSITNYATFDAIQESKKQALLRNLQALLPAGTFDNDLVNDRISVRDPLLGSTDATDVYRARLGEENVAVIISTVAPNGYNGRISMLVGIFEDGRIAGVRITSHRETPGLGDEIELSKSDWILDFDGKSLKLPTENQWRVKRDGGVFDQFTGATITPRAVVAAVHNTLKFYRNHKAQLFNTIEDP